MLIDLSFLSDIPLYDKEKPYTLFVPAQEGIEQSNCKFYVQNGISAEDVRGHEHEYTLDECGFTFLKHESRLAISSYAFQSNRQDDSFVKEYLQEARQLVKTHVQAERVLCFDWRLRKNTAAQKPSIGDVDMSKSRQQLLQTAKIAHLDYSPLGGKARLQRQFSESELELYGGASWRIRIINVWRPLIAKVYDAPLALCDPRTVCRNELIEEDKVHQDHWEEGLYLKYRETQKWYWLSEQSASEVTVFTTWDSEKRDSLGILDIHVSFKREYGLTVKACPPHASFQITKGLPAEALPRESVEVRLVVFNKKHAKD